MTSYKQTTTTTNTTLRLGRKAWPAEAVATLFSKSPHDTLWGRLVAEVRRVTPYGVFVAGITNINGIPGGGGTDTIVRLAPPPDTAAADSAAVDSTALDTASVDTTAVDTTTSDTATARPADPDTAGPDTTGTVPPDTLGVAHPSRHRLLLRRR